MQVVNRFDTDDDGLAALLAPRDDLVLEAAVGDGVFELDHGPFEHYRRTVTATTGEPGRHQVEETVDLEVAIPIWGALFRPLIRRTAERSEAPALRAAHDPRPRRPGGRRRIVSTHAPPRC